MENYNGVVQGHSSLYTCRCKAGLRINTIY